MLRCILSYVKREKFVLSAATACTSTHCCASTARAHACTTTSTYACTAAASAYACTCTATSSDACVGAGACADVAAATRRQGWSRCGRATSSTVETRGAVDVAAAAHAAAGIGTHVGAHLVTVGFHNAVRSHIRAGSRWTSHVHVRVHIHVAIHIHVGVRITVYIIIDVAVHAWSHVVTSACARGCTTVCTIVGNHAATRTHFATRHIVWRRSHPVPSGRHATEEVTTCVGYQWARCAVVVAVHTIAVVVVDAEAPATVCKHDGTIEVCVVDYTVPESCAEQIAECNVACSNHCHVVVVVVTQRHIVQILIHAPDVVVVDAIYLVDDEWVADTKCVSHAVGQEPCIAAHCCDAHALSVDCHCSDEEDDCCECSS